MAIDWVPEINGVASQNLVVATLTGVVTAPPSDDSSTVSSGRQPAGTNQNYVSVVAAGNTNA